MKKIPLVFALFTSCSLIVGLLPPAPSSCDQAGFLRCEANAAVFCLDSVEFLQQCGEGSCDPQNGFCNSCGDGVVFEGLQPCDDGNHINEDECTNLCQLSSCGDGFIHTGIEACDDGNTLSGDGCRDDCLSQETCGDGFIDATEDCDDGNILSGDGCFSSCTKELGFDCTSQPSHCTPICGDGLLRSGERCDDQNTIAGDGCRADCLGSEICGDGLQDLGEVCDDGDNLDNDECTNSCAVNTCGDGVALLAQEQCDDGNNIDGDGCEADCSFLSCGNGILEPPEQCDDGNTRTNDGCDFDCVPSRVVALDLGNEHSCALFRTGDVRCWGSGALGRLGHPADLFNNPNFGDNEAPNASKTIHLGGTAVELSVSEHSCALLSPNNVRCWGRADKGQLGYGNVTDIGDNENPEVAGDVEIGGTVAQIASGNFHTCALLNTGNVRCWGDAALGQLGYGNTTNIGDDELPSSAGDVNVGGTVVQLVAGTNHNCVLFNTGAVRCWGDAAFGKLGYGNLNNIGDNETPLAAGDVNVGGTVVQLASGKFHTCALLSLGTVRCWGKGDKGQLGYGNTNDIGDNEAPSVAGTVNLGGVAIQLAAGANHTCALLTTGKVRCWGDAAFGQLGYGNTNNIGDNEFTSSAGDVDLGGTVVQFAIGANHSCALLNDGNIRCWGKGDFGKLGYGNLNNIGDNELPSSAGDVEIF